MVEITKEFTFEAAHYLPACGPEHKCSKMHGHLFKVEVSVAGEIDEKMGWLMDFGELARIGNEVISRLDHKLLNEIEEIGIPTSENIAYFIFREMARRVPGVSAVTVHESPTSRCTVRPKSKEEGYCRVEVESSFSAAHFLFFPPDGRETIHGHDYRVRVALVLRESPLWGVEERLLGALRPHLEAMDHRLLLPRSPGGGRLWFDKDKVFLEIGPETLTFPLRDCALIDCKNTTTEAIAIFLAQKLATDKGLFGLPVKAVEVGLFEAGGASALATVSLESKEASD